MNINLAPIQASIAKLEAVGADKADPDAWTELLAAYNALVAEIKAASDPAGPGAERWTIGEILALVNDVTAVSQKVLALVSVFLPTAKAA